MELIFLDRHTLGVIGHALAAEDFDIVVDALVPQKSSFSVNGAGIPAEAGDLVAAREGGRYIYLGFVTSVEEGEGDSVSLKASDFLSAFDVEVPLPTSFSGNAAQFLIGLISDNFVRSGDPLQNLPYIECSAEAYREATLSYEADKKASIIDLAEEFSKTYGIRLEHELVLEDGKFSKVAVRATSAKVGIRIRSDLGTISSLSVSDANEDTLNKVVYVPKAENTAHTERVAYYLYSDGTVGTSASSTLRIPKVKVKYEYYSDKDYGSLGTSASKELTDSSLDHSITFEYSLSANKIEPLERLKVGVAVEFITPKKTYETLVTKMEFKGTLGAAKVTLGEYRLSLTDKLKIFDRRK